MSWRLVFGLSVVAALGGCGGGSSEEDVDSDGDGIMDADEIAQGLDPNSADSDGDGLEDGEELDIGSDPLLPDTDEDGYSDLDEVNEGSDPTDAESGIYKGGWPFYADKDSLEEGTSFKVGERVPRFVMADQHHEQVDLYDFYNEEGMFIVIDESAEWCPPCRAYAGWLDGDGSFDSQYPGVVDGVNNGDFYWITVLGEDYSGNPATGDTSKSWYQDFPNHNIPVLADDNYSFATYMGLEYWPTATVLYPNLKVAYTGKSVEGAMAWILDNGVVDGAAR